MRKGAWLSSFRDGEIPTLCEQKNRQKKKTLCSFFRDQTEALANPPSTLKESGTDLHPFAISGQVVIIENRRLFGGRIYGIIVRTHLWMARREVMPLEVRSMVVCGLNQTDHSANPRAASKWMLALEVFS